MNDFVGGIFNRNLFIIFDIYGVLYRMVVLVVLVEEVDFQFLEEVLFDIFGEIFELVRVYVGQNWGWDYFNCVIMVFFIFFIKYLSIIIFGINYIIGNGIDVFMIDIINREYFFGFWNGIDYLVILKIKYLNVINLVIIFVKYVERVGVIFYVGEYFVILILSLIGRIIKIFFVGFFWELSEVVMYWIGNLISYLNYNIKKEGNFYVYEGDLGGFRIIFFVEGLFFVIFMNRDGFIFIFGNVVINVIGDMKGKMYFVYLREGVIIQWNFIQMFIMVLISVNFFDNWYVVGNVYVDLIINVIVLILDQGYKVGVMWYLILVDLMMIF